MEEHEVADGCRMFEVESMHQWMALTLMYLRSSGETRGAFPYCMAYE